MTAVDMCSVCSTPAVWHDLATTYGDAGEISGPCPRLAQWAPKIHALLQQLLKFTGNPQIAATVLTTACRYCFQRPDREVDSPADRYPG
jgi:hypothetical protein